MSGGVLTDTGDEVQQMQDGVRDWVQRAAGRGKRSLRSASPAVVLSLLCASAFCPLLMAAGVAGAGFGVLSAVGSGFLTQVISDALGRLRQRGQQPKSSRDDLEEEIARQIQRVLAGGDERANILRSEIASVLKEIDAGGTALRAAMEQSNERVRGEVITAIGMLGSDFTEMAFLIKDVAQAAEDIQQSLDIQGADVRTIIEQNARQSTDIRLVREDLAAIAGRVRDGVPAGAGRGAGAARWVRGCPYRGLLPFDETDAEVFYGRERLVTELAVKLAARVSRDGLVIVTGASGAGKSSLLRAGLLPILDRGQQVRGSDRWPRIVMTPTKDPLTELAARLAAIGGNDTVAVRDGLAQHPEQAHAAVWSAVLANAARQQDGRPVSRDSGARLVLIVDQFEQLFTLGPGSGGESAQRAFVMALRAAATNRVGPKQEPSALVLIAVRGDFWDRCAAYPELADALQDGQFVVGPMTESEFRVAITGPADAAGLHIDPALTDTILGDLRAAGTDGATGVLPLLSQAMALTWEKREGDRLTSHGYSQTGGVGHAVQTGADKVYDILPAAQQAIARDVFRSLTVASRDGRLTRRPLTRADLCSGLQGADRSQVDAVLEAFAAERLIVLNDDTIQISHDVLLSAWPKLRAWLKEDQASWILYGQLADSVAAWHDSDNDPSFLYRGSHLTTLQQAAQRWAANPARYPVLNDTERHFLQASERAATRSSRQRRAAVAVLATLALVATLAFVFAYQKSQTALQKRDQAIYNQVIAEALQFGTPNPSLAAQLNLAAYHIQRAENVTQQPQNVVSHLISTENTALSTPLGNDPGPVYSVAYSPDGRTLASTGYDGVPQLWDVNDPAHPRVLRQPSGKGGLVYSVAFSTYDHLLASVGANATVSLWDVATPAHPRALGLLAHAGPVYSAAFSPDGRMLATGGPYTTDGTVMLWDVADPAHPKALGVPFRAVPGTNISQLLFSPDGRTLVVAGGGGRDTAYTVTRLWDIADPAHPHPLGPPLLGGGISFRGAAFSPDGRTLAIPENDNTVQLWDVSNPSHPHQYSVPLVPNIGLVYSVAFSHSGQIMATAGENGSIQLWNMLDPAAPQQLGQPLEAPTGVVYSVAFSPNGHSLVAGNNDGTIRLWSLPPTLLTAGVAPVYSVAFGLGGRLLASGDDDGTVRLWNTTDPAHPVAFGRPLVAIAGGIFSVAFSPNGRLLASGSSDGKVRLWNLADHAHPVTFGEPPTGTAGAIYVVAFSPDSRLLASGGVDNKVQLWNVTDPAHPVPLGKPLTGTTASVFSVAFSNHGRMMASGGGNSGLVKLWNVADPAHPQLFRQFHICTAGIVYSLAFSPNSHVLAGGCEGGTIGLWSVADPAHARALGKPLSSQVGEVFGVAFSPDGRTLASAGNDGTVGLWDVADPARPTILGQPLTASLSYIRSVAFGHTSATLATASGGGTVQLWNLKPGIAINRICAAASNVLTPRLWPTYIPQLPYQAPCPR